MPHLSNQIDQEKDQLKNMCKGSSGADAASAMDQKLMQYAMEESAKAGNPVKTLTPNPNFASHSAPCAHEMSPLDCHLVQKR